jgi:23S rRNA pseudouridine2605 synthase
VSPERLQKVLASAGIASRRDCEALIAAGRVMVNGRVVVVPGTRVDLDHDEVLVDGQPLQMPTKRTYIMLHKPAGVVSTAEDTHGRPTVLDLVNVPARVFPVGRLDMDSEGLILLTDDGELAYALTHPSFEVEKEYRVLLDRALTPEALRSWRNGVLLDGEMTAPAWVELIGTAPEGVWVRIVLREGRKRQIRAVAKLLGYEVRRLIRVREGDLVLGDLPPRAWRHLTDEEVAALRTHIAKRRPPVERSPGVAPSSVRNRDDERPSYRTPDIRSRGDRDDRGREFEREPRARRDSGERGWEFEREPRARRDSGERGREFEREPRARRDSGERGREFEREPRARRDSGERGREFEREPRARRDSGERGREFEREPRARRDAGERGREFEREPQARRDAGERGREFEREPRARSEERSRSTPSRSGPKSKPPSARSSQQPRSTGGEHQRRNERARRNKEKDQE